MLKLAFYGDDFTGSTDALEVLAFAGLRTALFLEPPSAQTLAQAGPLDAFGIAGDSRAMTPGEMDDALPPVFDALAASGAPIVHYKVCSTFDSSPEIGSIGRAMQIARRSFGHRAIPVVGGTPSLRRYCAFGHLFARSATDDQVHRIDRHPIMRAHPVTPMHESDLRLHLAAQASLNIASLPFTRLENGPESSAAHLQTLVSGGAEAVLFDSLTAAHLTEVGRLLTLQAATSTPLFVVGPSSVEYALSRQWRASGGIGAPSPVFERFRRVERVLAVSASASPLSAQQIDLAVKAGFAEFAVQAAALLDEPRWELALRQLVSEALRQLRLGKSVILHTARGPRDDRIKSAVAAMHAQGLQWEQARHEAGRRLGRRLGLATRQILREEPLERLLLSGGDTSSQIVKTLAPDALLVVARLTPGAPLCRVVSDQPWLDGLEVALKGGQMGDANFFDTARAGRT
ncbi:four-carbon acid sugar kinase family protein [Variovorax paradoxus]|uniref:Four-carbon acid sugar kinase family protein n=1 Tax=Variovorax paradoxus TaxID=34073 RepID=A0A0H2MHQ4_VARPD|nr:four-carbon acid sugar kinase family protein [Variovorax paradoxus]KLN56370.1 hypothetical protein VPARA_23120 [Variovorax paradoxus]